MEGPIVRPAGRLNTDAPSALNGLSVYSGFWKYQFDELTRQEIEDYVKKDPRPQWCAETFPEFHDLRVVELGPGDGYNSLALEMLGSKSLTVIEGNVDCFLRCLILKNAFDMKTQFELGDFTRMFDTSREVDLIYASGVLYHLPDPINFLEMASQHSKHLFLWTHFYEESALGDVGYAREAFSSGIKTTKAFKGRAYTYHRYEYNVNHVACTGYAGGLREYASWMSWEDLEAALQACGYKILRAIEDRPGHMMPAVNLFASIY